MLNVFRRRSRGGNGYADKALQRYRYKDVWNSASNTEDGAKFAVAGLADEAALEEAAEVTLAQLTESVGVHKDDVILEIGCGVGRVGNILAPRCRKWIGVDASDNMIKYTRKRLSRHQNIELIANNGYDLQAVPDSSVDLVYCTVVMMHLSQWDRYGYVREAFRVLRAGGRIFMDGVDLTSDYGWEFFLNHLSIPPQERPPNISELSTPQEFSTYLTRAGFKSIRLQSVGLWVVATAVK